MQKTKIGYLTHTWNPIAMRCTPVSDGCKNCWHLRMAKRLHKNPALPLCKRLSYHSGIPAWNDDIDAPVRLRKPARIGVQFMGDLFHDNVSDDFIDCVIQVIRNAEHHTFMVLTKRPERMLEYMVERLENAHGILGPFPPRNLWLGVSVEDQKTADERIPLLLQTPAAVRFVSYEPALGPVDFSRWMFDWKCPVCSGTGVKGFGQAMHRCPQECYCSWNHSSKRPDWIIMGGETGPGARPMHPKWARSVRDQCKAAEVPFWFKSWGEWERRGVTVPELTPEKGQREVVKNIIVYDDGNMMARVGAMRSGRLLDLKEYNELPGGGRCSAPAPTAQRSPEKASQHCEDEQHHRQ
jgi:protein gp37